MSSAVRTEPTASKDQRRVAVAELRGRVAILTRADVVALAGLVLLVAVTTMLSWGAWGDLDSDTGYDVQAGARMADGQLPYRDFIYYYGPLAPTLTAAAAFIGGSGFGPAVVLGFLITLAIIGATYAVARMLVGHFASFLAAAITTAVAFIPDDYSYVLPHTGAATLGTLLLLILLLVVRGYSERLTTFRGLAVGVVLGMLMLTKPEPALAGVVAVIVWLFVRRRAGVAGPREYLRVTAAAVALPVLVYGGFLAVVTPNRLIFENLYPRDFLEGNPLVHVRVPLTLDSFLQLGAKLVLYAMGVGILLAVAALLARGGRTRTLALCGIGAAIGLATTASLIRPEAMRHGLEFAYGWIPAAAALAAIVLTWRLLRGADPPTPIRQVELTGAVALAVLAATSYPGFFPHAPYEQIAAYAMPLAAIFIVRLHLGTLASTRPRFAVGAIWVAALCIAGLGLTIKDARFDGVVVRGPGGALAETRNEAALYQGALTWIDRVTEPGDPIFVAPLMPSLYTLSMRENPTDQLSLLPGSVPPGQKEQALIDRLDEAKVRLIVTDDRLWHVYGRGAFGKGFNQGLAAWINAHFAVVAVLRSNAWHSFEGDIPPRRLTIWERRP